MGKFVLSAQTIGLIRGAIMILGILFETGYFQTGVPGGGKKVNDVCMIVAVSLAAGQRNEPPPRDGEDDRTSAKKKKRLDHIATGLLLIAVGLRLFVL